MSGITCWSDEPDAVWQTRMADLDDGYAAIAEETAAMAGAYRVEPDALPAYDSPEWRALWRWVREAPCRNCGRGHPTVAVPGQSSVCADCLPAATALAPYVVAMVLESARRVAASQAADAA